MLAGRRPKLLARRVCSVIESLRLAARVAQRGVAGGRGPVTICWEVVDDELAFQAPGARFQGSKGSKGSKLCLHCKQWCRLTLLLQSINATAAGISVATGEL